MIKANLRENLKFDDSKPVLTVMFDSGFSREIRIVLKKGQTMKEHQTPFPIVVEVVKGKIEFGVDGVSTELNEGDLVALNGGIPHDLLGKEESIIRLSISKKDNVRRVEKILENS
ncbi:cupin domain-containing protein [Membranihabitans maritimus]|uniref:cupin domain-containing protein n=1 Tax=Membranihabitans maritimus TaxID=2904244 RepID=UPI001F24CF53|nr:cupin domain-containing protein [Membranihabitans maritimus]